jgi:hypothetical protein
MALNEKSLGIMNEYSIFNHIWFENFLFSDKSTKNDLIRISHVFYKPKYKSVFISFRN